MALRAGRAAADAQAARRIIADALPPALAAVVSEEQLDEMRHRLLSTMDGATHPHRPKRDWPAGLGVCLLCFLSTFPVAAPFMIVGDARTALRASNAV